MLVAVERVSRWYGNVVAVNDVSFTVGPGVTGLLGPNGAGKTTLLHMLAGLLAPSAGAVTVAGVTAFGDPELYRRVGLVPERETVYPYLDGREFVTLSATLHGVVDRAAVERAIATVDLADAADRRIGTYSKGMRQRIKMAGALVHDPPVLLLDEPFNGMDPRQRLHMFELLRGMAAAGRTILLSSHILEEVERVADSVLVMYAGRLAAAGDFRTLRKLMTDRPHVIRRAFVRRSPARGGPARRRLRVRRPAREQRARRAHIGLRALHAARDVPGARCRHLAVRAGAHRRFARVGLRLPGRPVSASAAIARTTLRGVLDRRRTWLMALLAAVPVIVALVFVVAGGQRIGNSILDNLVVRTVLPLIALVFGTAVLGSELEDGTIVYLLTTPVRRLRMVLGKGLVAAGVTAALMVPATFATALLAAQVNDRFAGVAPGFAVAVGIGGAAYALVFMTASLFTARALAFGLGYVLIWEGILSGLLAGTQGFSIRQATLSIAASLSGWEPNEPPMELGSAIVVLAGAIVGSLAISTWRLSRYEVRGGD